MQSLNPKAEFAPSALELTPTGNHCMLTTATKQGKSGEFCAPTAIMGLGSSETIQTRFIVQSSTYGNLAIEPWVVGCQLNKEQDRLKELFGDLAISIYGGLSDNEKITRHDAWLNGEAPIIICKPKMFGFGVNWQHCRNIIFVGLNDSFEQVYQGVKRCWRFGQTEEVTAHFIASELEGAVIANLKRKEKQAEEMADKMVRHMADLSSTLIRGAKRDTDEYAPSKKMELPSYFRQAVKNCAKANSICGGLFDAAE